MISFKEFFLEITNPHHRRDRRLTNRIGGYRNGKPEGVNMIAKRYKVEDHNYDQNSRETVGVISPEEAEELIAKHGMGDVSTPKRLGKRPFTLQKVNGKYIKNRI